MHRPRLSPKAPTRFGRFQMISVRLRLYRLSTGDHWLLSAEGAQLLAAPSSLSRTAGIQIFARLDFKSLARCARVSKRWNQSQTINYSATRFARPSRSDTPLTLRRLLPPISPPALFIRHRWNCSDGRSLVPALQGTPVLARRGRARDAPPATALKRAREDPAGRALGPQGVEG